MTSSSILRRVVSSAVALVATAAVSMGGSTEAWGARPVTSDPTSTTDTSTVVEDTKVRGSLTIERTSTWA
jgi:hypothetical protein